MTMLDFRRTVPVGDVPDLATMVRQLGFLTPDAAARLDAIEQARFVLVKMDQGEYWKCGRCGGKHSVPDVGPVLTRFCVPRPWRGLQQGLYAYYQHLGARATDLSLEQRARAASIAAEMPDLARSHPQAAQALMTRSGDLDYVGWLIGSVVEISEADARKYANLINGRAHRIVVKL